MLLAAGALLFCAGARAAPNDCKPLVSRVAQAVGSNFDRHDEARNTFFFKIADGAEIQVRCLSGTNKSTVIYVRAASEYPPRSFYETLAKVGASVTGHTTRDVKKWAHHCHRVAKRSANGRAERGIRNVGLECRRSEARSGFLIKGPFLHQS